MPALGTPIAYDPAVAVQQSAASLLAMTALDTTHLRSTVTVPANGAIVVRGRVGIGGGTGLPHIMLGVLEGATVVFRQYAAMPTTGASIVAGTQAIAEMFGVVPGLSPGSHVLDLAYGVELVQASSNVQYGGPNDTTGNDGFGAAVFDVWDTTNLLGACAYDPASVATKVTTALLAMTALDTTNLRLTFTAPASGNVYWRIRTCYQGNSTPGQVLLGVLESTTVVARAAPMWINQISGSTVPPVLESSGVVTGVSAGSHTWDASYAVQVVSGAGGGLKFGGPNDTTTNNAFGAIIFELWTA